MRRIAIVLSTVLLLAGYADAQQRKIVTPAGRTYYTGRKPLPPAVAKQLHDAAQRRHGNLIARLPKVTAAQFDCRQNGWVPPIRDQGQCGSCWDFSGSGVVTSALIKAGQIPNSANGCSEQYTLDCGQNGGCGGDDNITVLQWAKATGLPLDKDYGVSYQASAGRCRSTSGLKMYRLQDWGFCTPDQQGGVARTEDIKKALVAYGPVGLGIDANVLGDGTGIVSGSGHSIDHDVIVVGWDDSKGRGGCWIMRNSWGTGWGQACGGIEGGYCYIEYGSGDIGTEACWALAASTKPPPPWVFSTSLTLPQSAPCCGQQAKTHCGCYITSEACTCSRDKCQCYGGQDCRKQPQLRAARPYADCPPCPNGSCAKQGQCGNVVCACASQKAAATYSATFTTASDRAAGHFGSALFGISADLPQPLPAGTYSAVLTPVGQRAQPFPAPCGCDSSCPHYGQCPVDGTCGRATCPQRSKVYRDPQTGRRWRYTGTDSFEYLPEPAPVFVRPQAMVVPAPMTFGGFGRACST